MQLWKRANRRMSVLLAAVTVCVAGGVLKAVEADKLPEDVRGILEKTAGTYRQARTYSDTAFYKMSMQFGDMTASQEMPWQVVFERPDKVNAKAFGAHVVADGKQQFTHLTIPKEYKVAAAPAALDPDGLFAAALGIMDGDTGLLISLWLLTDEEPLTFLIGDAETVTKAPDETIGDRACHVLLMGNAQNDRTCWIDKQSNLILRYRSRSKTAKNMGAGGPSATNTVDIDFRNARVGNGLNASAFAIPTPEGAQKVDRFRSEQSAAGGEFPSPLLGRPAPDFVLKDLDGNEIKLASAAGKVVVLDFWATWCGPCIQAMPDMQKIHKRFSSKNVMILGINTDQGNPRERIEKVIRSNGVTFPTLMDGAGAVAGKYGVDKLPSVILIDKSGKVAKFHIGGGPGKRQVLTQAINGLLAQQ